MPIKESVKREDSAKCQCYLPSEDKDKIVAQFEVHNDNIREKRNLATSKLVAIQRTNLQGE